MNPFFTHRPHLRSVLDSFDYSKAVRCLELGVGDGSSEVFSSFAAKYHNLLISAFETDGDWLQTMKNAYQRDNYQFNLLDSWDDFRAEGQFDLVFVDQSPWNARIASIDLIGTRAKVFVLHDYDYFNKGVCENIYSVGEDSFFAKYRNDFELFAYREFLPPTLVMKRGIRDNRKD